MNKQELKELVCKKIDELQPVLYKLADYLHAHPEVSAQEINSVEYIKNILINYGFSFKSIIEDKFSTAFVSMKENDNHVDESINHKKKIGFMAEYDALPNIGHGCGHNLIAMMSIGAAIAFNQVTNKLTNKSCETIVYGCAAEETTGAKLDMAERGFFDGVEAALIIHPDDKSTIGGTSYATHPMEFTFIGKEAHVADPEYHGINALDALVDFYQRFKELKKTFNQQSIVGMIITEGGIAPNIIPAKAILRATIRSMSTDYLENIMLPQIKDLANAVAKEHHAEVKMYHYEPLYKDLKNDDRLNKYYQDNFSLLGEKYIVLPNDYADGSTDVGNVSYVTRTCQPCIAIANNCELFVHTKEFADAAGSNYGKKQALLGAKAIAMTAVDVLLED